MEKQCFPGTLNNCFESERQTNHGTNISRDSSYFQNAGSPQLEFANKSLEFVSPLPTAKYHHFTAQVPLAILSWCKNTIFEYATATCLCNSGRIEDQVPHKSIVTDHI